MSTVVAETPRHDWRFFALLARAVVGGLFLVSAVAKIIAPEQFAKEIREYEMLPIITTNAVAYVLPWVELLAGVLLVVGVWRKEARVIIVALLVVFTIAKTYAYATGKEPGCGCGGNIQVLKYIYDIPQGILTNLILLALLWVDRRAERFSRRSADVQGHPVEITASNAPEST
ncbi:MAG: MauE/DoxX family redox-associated membrane protein [Phycisphaerae bacterium]